MNPCARLSRLLRATLEFYIHTGMKYLVSLLLLLCPCLAFSQTDNQARPVARQKQIYIPDSLRLYNLDDDSARWCWRHTVQTQNLVFFWEKGFGDNPYEAPKLQGQPMTFDIGNLQVRLERFYHYFRDTLKFTLPGSISDQHKMMVMIDYSLDGTAYGGTYDDFIGALWVAPNRIQDKKLNALAHELGHSFQLQLMADKTGEAWGGNGFFEMTSQWMLWRVNPDWIKDEQYHFDAFKKLTHKGFLALDNIYHSPYVIEWWAEKHGLSCVADLYRAGKVGEDPVMTYKRIYGLSQQQFNDEMFDCYRHLVNFDFQYARANTRPFACSFNTPIDFQRQVWIKPDTAYIPENYGFNAIKIPLTSKDKGVKVTVCFRACSDNGYRYGLVGVTADDRCLYGRIESKPVGSVTFRPGKDMNLKALYLIVMGAPVTHDLNPSSRKFPYEIKVN